MMSFNYLTFKKTFMLFMPNLFHHKVSRHCALAAISLIFVDILIASFLLPRFSKQIATAFSSSVTEALSIAILAFGALWTLEKVLSYVQDIIFFPVINYNIRGITYRVIHKMHHIPLHLYQNLSIPETLNILRRISMSARAFIKIIMLLFIPTVIKVGIAVYSAVKFGPVGFIIIPSILICLGVLYKGTQWYVKTRETAWQFSDQVIMRLQDGILNTKITRFHLEEEMAHMDHLLKKEANLWYHTNTRMHLIPAIIAFLLGLTITFILFQAFQNVTVQHLEVGDFLLLKTQLLAAFLPFKQFCLEFRQLAEASIDIKKVLAILALPNEEIRETIPQNEVQGSLFPHAENFSVNASTKSQFLNCQAVSFGYSEKKLILKDCTFQVVAGEKVAILGDNGSGKSTLLRILCGLESPQQGRILLQKRHLRHYSRSELRTNLHYIPQDLRLFNISLRENISYGSQACSDTLILNALAKVGLMPLIEQLPKGLESTVGELGSLLSGGEIQRIALARALILQPKILLLDETLHSLDVDGEKRMLEALQATIPTLIIVSHRPSTLNFVDKIYRISNHCLAEIKLTDKDFFTRPFSEQAVTNPNILSEQPYLEVNL